jgi:hypothetical protein
VAGVTWSPSLHTVADDVEAVYEYAYANGWTDGLPIIPPTATRVARMITYLGRDGGEVIAELPPRWGKATIELIAINAVMAGCRPEYLPVLLAAVKGVGDPAFGLHGVQPTTNAQTPFIIVNGPIRHEIDLNCGRGCLGPGWRANATIGRALRLILLNIGGGIPAETDMATHGWPGKFTLCCGEDEEHNPWGPLSATRGFVPGQDTVTVFAATSMKQLSVMNDNPNSIMTLIADSLQGFSGGGLEIVLIVPSGCLDIWADAGLGRADVQRYLWERAGTPLDSWPPGSVLRRNRARVVDDKQYVVPKPDNILMICAGAPEPYHLMYLPNAGPDSWSVTVPVDEL